MRVLIFLFFTVTLNIFQASASTCAHEVEKFVGGISMGHKQSFQIFEKGERKIILVPEATLRAIATDKNLIDFSRAVQFGVPKVKPKKYEEWLRRIDAYLRDHYPDAPHIVPYIKRYGTSALILGLGLLMKSDFSWAPSVAAFKTLHASEIWRTISFLYLASFFYQAAKKIAVTEGEIDEDPWDDSNDFDDPAPHQYSEARHPLRTIENKSKVSRLLQTLRFIKRMHINSGYFLWQLPMTVGIGFVSAHLLAPDIKNPLDESTGGLAWTYSGLTLGLPWVATQLGMDKWINQLSNVERQEKSQELSREVGSLSDDLWLIAYDHSIHSGDIAGAMELQGWTKVQQSPVSKAVRASP